MKTLCSYRGRSYRLRLRSPEGHPAVLEGLDDFIQLKAPTAERAMQLAHLVTGKAVIDATRIEARA